MKLIATVATLVLTVLGGLYLANWVGVIAFSDMSGAAVGQTISTELSAKVGNHVTVTCPVSIPEKKGDIEDCAANAGHGTSLVRLVQDDSRGHFHYSVNDPDRLVPSPAPVSTAPATDTSIAQACTNAGGVPGQCGCIEEAIKRLGTGMDVIRAIASYDDTGRLPDDLSAMADGCRIGA